MSDRPKPECRPLRRDERAAWEPLFAGYQDFYRISLGDEVVDTTWRRFHDPVEPVFAAGAFEGGRLLGIVHYIFHRSTWMLGPTCYLQDLFTIPEARGRGVGRSLIEYVYERAAEAGAGRVYWLTHESNRPGRLLYDRVAENAGFIQYRKNLDN
jgi:GNAT superfamily N-acetyltransferase